MNVSQCQSRHFRILLLLFFPMVCFAATPLISPMKTTQANWIFSGIVTNEHGNHYGYFFQVKRENHEFQSRMAVLDHESGKSLLFYEHTETIESPQEDLWQIGQSFLTFNPITESWIFGFKTKSKSGFNFKVDMLSRPDHTPFIRHLRPGMTLLITQTGRLNGHIQIEGEVSEQFLTAENTWYRHVWLTQNHPQSHAFSGLLCRFFDGSSLYAAYLPEKEAHQGAIAGLYDAQGVPQRISQFIHVTQPSNEEAIWHIHIPSPERRLVVNDALTQPDLLSGFVDQGTPKGFCLFNQDNIGASLYHPVS